MVLNQCEHPPTFIVAGAAKCGTTSLYHYLQQHPDVYMSPIKEPNFFSTDIDPREFSEEYKRYERSKKLDISVYINGDMKNPQWGAYVRDEELYCKLFRFGRQKQARGEISNSYLFSSVAAMNIRRSLPECKIIIILRQPAERAFSHYLANLRDGRTAKDFRDEIIHDDLKSKHGWGISHLYFELGLYYHQIKRYLDQIPQERIKIILAEELQNNSTKTLEDVFHFLGLEPCINFEPGGQFNEARVPKSPLLVKFITQTGIKRRIFRMLPMSLRKAVKSSFFKNGAKPELTVEDYRWMTERYRSDIEKLGALLNRDFSHWLAPKSETSQ